MEPREGTRWGLCLLVSVCLKLVHCLPGGGPVGRVRACLLEEPCLPCFIPPSPPAPPHAFVSPPPSLPSAGDYKEVVQLAASLCCHLSAAPDLLPRPAFLKYAIEAQVSWR